MIAHVVKKDKRLFYLFHLFSKYLKPTQKKILKKIDNFLKIYSKFHNLNEKQIVKNYFIFLNRYIDDCKIFKNTNKYPYQLSKKKNVKRISYEIALILSCLITPHRFSIMEEICKLKNLKKTLFIGAGTGLEIFLLNDKIKNFKAYDKGSSNFLYKIAKKKFKKEIYKFNDNQFDTIFAIELLEHLKKPYIFLQNLYSSMKKSSRLVCTTAKNIPQFDHYYNFKSKIDFEKKIKKIGYKIEYSYLINHKYDMQKINSNNIFYILKK